MAFLTINGWEIPVKEIKETSEMLGTYKRVFSGSMRSMVNAVKRRWNVTTNPLTLEEAEALKGYLKGEGVHWNFEDNTLTSDKGHIPNTGYVATWMQNGGKYGSGVKVETNGNLYYSMGLESERGLTIVGYVNLLTLPGSNYAPLWANGNNSLTIKDNKPLGRIFTTSQATISGTTTLSTSAYYQLALTYNRSKIKIFCNGIKEGETTQTGDLLADWYSSIGMQFGGTYWTTRTSAADNNWRSVCYGNGLFVAVAYTGTGNRVMTSPDGSYLNGIADCILYLPYSLPEAAILGLYNLGRDIPNLPKIYVSGDFIYPSSLEVLGEVNDADYIQFWNNGVWTTGQTVSFTLVEV